jgi:hypothetical protein
MINSTGDWHMKDVLLKISLVAVVVAATLSAHALTLEDALDATGIVWLSSGFSPTTNILYTYDLHDAAYGGSSAWIEMRIMGPATIRFRWCHYESGFGFDFCDNGYYVYSGSNRDVWQLKEYIVTNGEHALRWLGSYVGLDTVSINGGTPLIVMYTNFFPQVVTNYMTVTNVVPIWITNGFMTVTNQVPLWITNGFVTITNGFLTVTNTIPLWITNGFLTVTNMFVTTNQVNIGFFDAAVTVQKPAEGAAIKAKAWRGIKLKGIAATSGMVPIIGVQASADEGNTWSAGLVTDKGTWKIYDAASYAQGAVTLRVRAVSASNDVSQVTQRHVTIQRR